MPLTALSVIGRPGDTERSSDDVADLGDVGDLGACTEGDAVKPLWILRDCDSDSESNTDPVRQSRP